MEEFLDKMLIRRAEEKDIPKVIELLNQVLELHAVIRPDIFISGTTKYTEAELIAIFKDNAKPVYVAVDEEDMVRGYVLCVIRKPVASNNMVPHRNIFIDDLCVDNEVRGQKVGQRLFEFVKEEAKKMNCYEVILNVWEGNDNAVNFYRKMGMKTRATLMEIIL